jgi:hypothetical protein
MPPKSFASSGRRSAGARCGFEDAGQVLDQLAEIHAAVRGEVEGDLAAVEGVLHADQLHVELVLCDLLLCDLRRFLLLFAVLDQALSVVLRGDADDRAQRGNDGGFLHVRRLHGDLPVLDALSGFDDDAVSFLISWPKGSK